MNTGNNILPLLESCSSHTENTMMNIPCECGRGTLFLFSPLLPTESECEKRRLLKLCPVFCTEQQRREEKKRKEKTNEVALIVVITLQLCYSDFCPSWKHIHPYPQTTCILRNAGYVYRILTDKNVSVTRTGFYCIWIGELV